MKYPTHDVTALLQGGKFTDGDPLEVPVIPPSPDRAAYMNMVFDELLNVLAAGGVTPDYALTNQVQAAIAAQIAAPLLITRTHLTVERQTVLNGPETDGVADFLVGSGGDTLLLKSGVATTPLRVSFADGFDDYGERNLVISIDAVGDIDPWTLTSDMVTNYLYIEADAFLPTAELTTGISTLSPSYGNVPPASPTNGQYWFSTSQFKGYVYNGSAWVPTLRVYVGEGKSSGVTLFDIANYAYRGKATIVSASPISLDSNESWSLPFDHNIGVPADRLASKIMYRVDSVIAGTAEPIEGEVFESIYSNTVSGSNQQGATSIWHGRIGSTVNRAAAGSDLVYLAASSSDRARTTAYVIADFWRSF
jgi:hypothetical protein